MKLTRIKFPIRTLRRGSREGVVPDMFLVGLAVYRTGRGQREYGDNVSLMPTAALGASE